MRSLKGEFNLYVFMNPKFSFKTTTISLLIITCITSYNCVYVLGKCDNLKINEFLYFLVFFFFMNVLVERTDTGRLKYYKVNYYCVSFIFYFHALFRSNINFR